MLFLHETSLNKRKDKQQAYELCYKSALNPPVRTLLGNLGIQSHSDLLLTLWWP